MIEVYNILSGLHDSNSAIQFQMSNIADTSRDSEFNMQFILIHYKLQNAFFLLQLLLYGTVCIT